MNPNILNSKQMVELLEQCLTDGYLAVMVPQLTEQMAEREGVTEQIKSTNQMAWVGAMSNI